MAMRPYRMIFFKKSPYRPIDERRFVARFLGKRHAVVMAINSEIRDQAYQFFVEEAPELLQAIEAGILHLRQERDTATIHTIMRSAHSLKGGAASVGLDAIKSIAHRLETIFKALYSDRLDLDAQLEQHLLQGFDCLRFPLMAQLSEGGFDAEQALTAADPILSKLEVMFAEAIAETENFVPSSTDSGFNMATSIFEIDVQQGLDHLTEVLAAPHSYDVAAELRAQAEVFLGFAELLDFPGFARIAQTTMQALTNHPDQALDITGLALVDFQQGRKAVLTGDLTVGGQPSEALLALAEAIAPPAADSPDQRTPDPFETMTIAEATMLLEKLGENPEEVWLLGNIQLVDSEDAAIDLNPRSPVSDPAIPPSIALDELLGGLIGSAAGTDSLSANNDSPLSSDRLPAQPIESESSEFQFDPSDEPEKHTLSQFSESDLSIPEEPEEHAKFQSQEFQCNPVEEPKEQIQYQTRNPEFEYLNEGKEQDSPQPDESQLELSDESETHPLHESIESQFSPSDEPEDQTLLQFTDPPAALSDESTDLPPTHLTEPESDRSDALDPSERAEPSHQSNSPSLTSFTPVTPASRSITRKKQPLAPELTVRVDANRLARMNNVLGELIINRNGLALQHDQWRSLIKELGNRFARFQTTMQQLRTTSDQMLIEPRGGAPVSSSTRSPLLGSKGQPLDFDSLEMDTYTTLYSHTQTLLEEMVQLEEAMEDMALFQRQSEQLLGQQRKMLSQMQDEVMWASMMPLEKVLNRFPRILRDLSNTYHKPVTLDLSGTELLIDKAVLEKLYDPLLHLLRNSFDHGIESVEERIAQGKPDTGQIAIRAFYRGRQVLIEVQDDGQGINLERIRQKAVESGQLSEDAAAQASTAQLYDLIFEPGFSTAPQVSDLSGRGIGLDVVREQLRSLKGTVSVVSTPRQGTTFTLTLPLTLTVANLLIGFVGSTPVAFRNDGITAMLIPQPDQITQVGNERYLRWQDQDIPAYRLSDLLTYTCLIPETPPSRVLAAVPSPTDWEAPMLILKRGQQPIALQIDRLVTDQELVIKPFGAAIAPPRYAYGCTVLGDGSLIPVIDGIAFLDALVERVATTLKTTPQTLSDTAVLAAVVQENTAMGAIQPAIHLSQATTVLVVDDAVTSRRMLAVALERDGYRVLQARDGQDALEQLQQTPSIQLIVCDIEMPNMNGFEFLTQRRQNQDLAKIPTIMLTSRSNDKHRWLAMQLGATDYFTKPYLEQEFLGAIAQAIAAHPL